MVKIKVLSILSAGVLVLSCTAPLNAGTVLRLPTSRGVPVASGESIIYGSAAAANGGRAVIDATLDGFLLCNQFDGATSGANSGTRNIHLRARHGSWLFGNTDAVGIQGSVTGIKSVTYGAGSLEIGTCDAGGDPACGGAALQCYTADANGMAVADTRQMFYDGFDALDTGASGDANHPGRGNSSISIQVLNMPKHVDDTFRYRITVTLPHSPANEGTIQSTTSSPASKYVLKEGYDTSIFSSCTALLGGGQEIPASGVIEGRCKMIDYTKKPPEDVPVVVAALFTHQNIVDADYSDNVAFGYPRLTSEQ